MKITKLEWYRLKYSQAWRPVMPAFSQHDGQISWRRSGRVVGISKSFDLAEQLKSLFHCALEMSWEWAYIFKIKWTSCLCRSPLKLVEDLLLFDLVTHTKRWNGKRHPPGIPGRIWCRVYECWRLRCERCRIFNCKRLWICGKWNALPRRLELCHRNQFTEQWLVVMQRLKMLPVIKTSLKWMISVTGIVNSRWNARIRPDWLYGPKGYTVGSPDCSYAGFMLVGAMPLMFYSLLC